MTVKVHFKFFWEVPNCALQTVERVFAEIAEGSNGDHFAEVGEHGETAAVKAIVFQVPQKLVHALGALAAGNALSAELRLRVLHEAADRVNDAAILVKNSNDAVAAAYTIGLEYLKVKRKVKMLLRQDSAAGAADLNGLEFFAAHDAAANIVNHFADRRAFLGNIYIPRMADVTLK